jgi:DNA-binding PadR family transcriptional regulator
VESRAPPGAKDAADACADTLNGVRLESKGWIAGDWGTSDNNRRARFYSITRAGKKQLAAEAANWARTVAIVNGLLADDS